MIKFIFQRVKLLFISVLVLLIVGCLPIQKDDGPSLNSFAQLKEWLVDPPSEYRSAPLWDWNDRITEEGIAFQLQEFKKAGIGGVFVHPRPGLITEYMSEDWHQLFDFTVHKGKDLGLRVWIYDENSYPSGFAGGHVPAEMPDSYRHGTGLSVENQDVFNPADTDVYEVILKQTDSGFENITEDFEPEIGSQGKFYLFKRTYPPTSYWYGGKTYVDLLYKGVTDKFMDITMEGYEKFNKSDFGLTVPGIFTDEPNLEAAMGPETVFRWTPDLWESFQSRWGYDLKVNLPSLLYEVGDWKRIRHDYYELILEMFLDRWAIPWSKYCEKNGLAWTGHYWEHGWPEPTHGFDEAAFYIWHQMPGIDMLGNELIGDGQGGQFGNARAVRELLSAANQAGWNRTLSETYGGGGWEMDFRNFKRLVDWQGVLGVNFVNQHLSYYTIKGVRKFDYPPSFSYHEPWWNSYKKMGDYIGRISMAMSAGEQINKTLVLQPNTTAWMYYSRVKSNPAIEQIRRDFKHFIYQMEREQIEYDLGSENVLKTLGKVENGKLVVGKRAYETIVIPDHMENIDRTTYELLKDFLADEGEVLSFCPKISRVDGIESEEVRQLQQSYPDHWITVNNLHDLAVETRLYPNDFSVNELSAEGELYHQRRILEDGQLLLLVNSDQYSRAYARIQASGKSVVKLDLENGDIHSFPNTIVEGKLSFDVQLEPVGSALFFISDQVEEYPEFVVGDHSWTEVSGMDDDIQVVAESDNILVINYLDLYTPKGEMEDVYFMEALVALFNKNGIDFGNPWQHKIQYKTNYIDLDTTFTDSSGFEVEYHFQVARGTDLSALVNAKAVVERPELWTVSINDSLIEKEDGEYWIDIDYPVYKIGQLLKHGRNTITLRAERMSIFAEIMPVYILGDFIVRPIDKGFEIANGSLSAPGSWADAGYPFYSDKISYSQKYSIEKGNASFKVKLTGWNGTIAEVLVNKQEAGIIAWPPEELDLTKMLRDGENEISVRIVGSLKNTFGYFYEDNNKWIHGPHDWNRAPEQQPGMDQYYFMDYGLFSPFDLWKTAD
jgi:hypothetical protein